MPICACCLDHFADGSNKKRFCSVTCATLKRPFRVFDGEGRTFDDGSHKYILLACTDGVERDELRNEDGIETEEALAFLTRKRHKAINTWFGFGYDVNKICENVRLFSRLLPPTRSRQELWEAGTTHYRGFRLSYTPRKIFQVTNRETGISFHSYDTIGFFQKAFIKVCKDFHVDTSRFEHGKAERGNFAAWSLDQISEYNFYEMEAMLEVLNTLRMALYRSGVLPAQWHGPGAVAATWLAKHDVRRWYADPPEEMVLPIAHAYFGGRIDIAAVGEARLFEYDLASAYPAALTRVIAQNELRWILTTPEFNDPHALYRVKWNMRRKRWGPFPWRAPRGNVLFPLDGEGWYWGCEVLAAERAFPGAIERVEAWVPFGAKHTPLAESIQTDYDKRLALDAAGDASALGIKLSLNSIYGKMAQHHARDGKTPRFRNYIWAGWTTAWCRAQILDVLAEVGQENLVAVATDGVFTRTPLQKIDTQKTLGTWQQKSEGRVLLCSPGLYATFDSKGEARVYKARGMPAAINYGYVLRDWGCTTMLSTPGAESDHSERQAFIGMGQALHLNDPSACGTFQTQERQLRNVTIFGTSKRQPDFFSVGTFGWEEFALAVRPRPPGTDTFSAPYRYRKDLDATAEDE